jgi:TROVE domain
MPREGRQAMATYNDKTVFAPRQGASPLQAAKITTGRTWEGAQGFLRDSRTQLFLSATTRYAGENSFYETGPTADDRIRAIARGLATDPDGWAWLQGFLPWLRGSAQIRTASVMLAAEVAHARWQAGLGSTRPLVASVLQRADEPGEFMAYWFSQFGRKMPVAVKRALADAVQRLYTEYSWLAYDNTGKAFRFADVIELACPRYHLALWGAPQDSLYRYIIESRHSRGTAVPERLGMLRANQEVRAAVAQGDYSALTSPGRLHQAGITWQAALSMAGSHVSKDRLWESQLPVMGYMALLRNLRNIDESGLPDALVQEAMARIADQGNVLASRQLPYRFLSAYLHAPSLRWAQALETALDHATALVPSLPGRTLALVDISGSMGATLSQKSKITRAMAGALFAGVLAKQNPGTVDLAVFATGRRGVPIRPHMSALKVATEVTGMTGSIGYGTMTAEAVRAYFRRQDRVIIFTDGQSFPAGQHDMLGGAVPAATPVYSFDLAGYKHTGMAGGPARHELGGLTDHTFAFMRMLEDGKDAKWPWEQEA